jgi:hypothetical protein
MITLTPIGHVRTTRADPVDDNWDAETTTIELDSKQFTPDALLSLDQFSHVEVIYWFHHEEAAKPNLGARRPRGREDWPLVGISPSAPRTAPTDSASPSARFSKSKASPSASKASTPSTARLSSISNPGWKASPREAKCVNRIGRKN